MSLSCRQMNMKRKDYSLPQNHSLLSKEFFLKYYRVIAIL